LIGHLTVSKKKREVSLGVLICWARRAG